MAEQAFGTGAVDQAFTQYEDQWLANHGLVPEPGEPELKSVEKGTRFFWEALAGYLSPGEDPAAFRAAHEGDDIQYLDRSGDGGVDGSYWRDELDGSVTLYVIQSKYGKSLGDKSALLAEFSKFKTNAEATVPLVNVHKESTRFFERFRSFCQARRPGNKVVWLILTTHPLSDGHLFTLGELEKQSGQSPLFGGMFETLTVSLRDVMRREYGRPPFVETDLQFMADPGYREGERVLLGTVSLGRLMRFMTDYEKAAGSLIPLYAENVRLEQSGPVNAAMRRTLEE
ncbi:MAG: hypothetical protein Q7U75_03660, partial [Desulfobacterales bacterium]|nr:hypothetical protein [Desulfobacterales bacterium]